jgi:DNA-binding transcriptional MerR regulator
MKDSSEIKKKIPMRELEKLTNMTRATINFYIKEGLLPIPQKSAKNMAYYDEEFIDKLKYIEKMRNADFTLNQIKKLVNYDTKTINGFGLQILESVNKLLPYGIDQNMVNISQIKEIGFNDENIIDLIKLRIIISTDESNTMFPAYSMTVCRFVKYFIDLGVPLTVAKDIVLKLKELADIEKNAFINYIRSPMIDNKLSEDEQKQEVQKCIENINGLLPILHLQLIKLPNEVFRRY